MNGFSTQYTNILKQIKDKYNTLTPLLHRISALVITLIDKNFSAGGRWDGSGTGLFSGGPHRWTPLAKSTQKVYQKLGYDLKPTLNRTGRLRASIDAYPQGKSSIVITANASYASTHQFGATINIPARESSAKWKAKKNKATGNYSFRFANKKSNTKNTIARKFMIPAYSINIPARPFITLTDSDLLEILEEIIKYNID